MTLEKLAINEVAPAGAAPFWIELANDAETPIELGGYVIATSTGREYVLGAQSLAAGSLLAINQTELGFQPLAGERLFLYAPDRAALIDARAVETSLRGRSGDFDNEWLYPTAATPGAENVFDIQDAVVINEIMYNRRPDSGTPGTPAEVVNTRLFSLDADWKYNDVGADLGSDWFNTNFNVDNFNWFSGPGLLALEDATLPAAINTTLTLGADTYYFQREFSFTGNPTDVDALVMGALIDDGAVFYLNGQELLRVGMPGGAVDATTLASRTVGDATLEQFVLPAGGLVVGTNVLSVEVHQRSSSAGPNASSDIVFGMELFAQQVINPGTPGGTFQKSKEEWIELFNRSDTETVDLSGWKLNDAVDYEFPVGTVLAPGQYLVVARDAAALQAKYPGVASQIVGDFGGKLSNTSQRIRLLDTAGNPADEVRYFEGGQWPEAADGGGSSLELRDADADNSNGAAWAESDESSRSQWQTVTYSDVAGSDIGSNSWNEFLFGMLDSGQVLIDDVSVIQNPGTPSARQLIQNGSFESDTIGTEADKWRIIGNHSGVVAGDPANPGGNQVLRLTATGSTRDTSNQAGTTLKDGNSFVAIGNGSVYEISYRAKWISGSNQFNSRLYFNTVKRTTRLEQPQLSGRPLPAIPGER